MVSFTIHYLIPNVWYRDVFVDFDSGFVVPEQVENVCDCRGDPSSPLIEEFVEPVRKKKVKTMFFLEAILLSKLSLISRNSNYLFLSKPVNCKSS